MTDDYDANNPAHRKIAHGIEVGDGIPEMRTIARARQAFKNVGFELLHEEDLADRGDKIVRSRSPALSRSDGNKERSPGTTRSRATSGSVRRFGTFSWSGA